MLGVFLFISSTACATITRGTNDTLVIETDPPTTDATLSNGHNCKTPCSIKMSRKENCVVKIEKEGYEPVEVNVTPQISGGGGAGMAGNVLFGGLIGVAVDAGSGAMYDLKPNPISVKLEKKIIAVDDIQQGPVNLPPPSAAREKTHAERLDELNEMKDKGLISDEEFSEKREVILNDL